MAYGNIVAQEFTAFLPLGMEPGKPARPLFPRYLFVEIARGQNWWPIMSTRGVSTILCTTSGFPVPVPLDVMAELRMRLDPEDSVHFTSRARRRNFEKGKRVKIIEGPFQSLDALFVALRGKRDEILLDIVGRAAKVTVDAKALRQGSQGQAHRRTYGNARLDPFSS